VHHVEISLNSDVVRHPDMSVILEKFSLFYAPVPKIACTSLKLMFFEAENGFPFRRYTANGRNMHIHAVYPSSLSDKIPHKSIQDFHRVTLVRDPVQRFLSAYSNRVIHFKELSPAKAGPKLEKMGLEYNPELDLFINKFAEYQNASASILHHSQPMVDFLGKDAAYYSKIYPMNEIDQFVTDMSERMGVELSIGRHQTGGPKLNKKDLTKSQSRKIEAFYKDDYRVFKNYL